MPKDMHIRSCDGVSFALGEVRPGRVALVVHNGKGKSIPSMFQDSKRLRELSLVLDYWADMIERTERARPQGDHPTAAR